MIVDTTSSSSSRVLPIGVWEQIIHGLEHLHQATDKSFGSPTNPLLLSVRSGAAISMPGMMDTILNLGLNDVTVLGLAATGGNRFAYVSISPLLSLHHYSNE